MILVWIRVEQAGPNEQGVLVVDDENLHALGRLGVFDWIDLMEIFDRRGRRPDCVVEDAIYDRSLRRAGNSGDLDVAGIQIRALRGG